MKLYTHQVIGWDDKEHKNVFKSIIINSEDIIDIGNFGYGLVNVLLKDGINLTCSAVFFQKPTFYNEFFDDAEEITCENHEFYEKLYSIKE
jgi:hypothetical protein